MAPGRPSKLTREVERGIARLVREGVPGPTAAEKLNIHRDTFSNWMARGENPEEKDPRYSEFFQKIKKARATAIQKMVNKVRAAASDKWQAAAWWLERYDPENWSKHEYTHPPIPDKPKIDLSELDPNRPSQYLAALPKLILSGQVTDKQVAMLIKVISAKVASIRAKTDGLEDPAEIDDDPQKALEELKEEVFSLESRFQEMIERAGEEIDNLPRVYETKTVEDNKKKSLDDGSTGTDKKDPGQDSRD